MVDRAGSSGSTKINFVVTHYFVDEDKNFVPEYYCYKAAGESWIRRLFVALADDVAQGHSQKTNKTNKPNKQNIKKIRLVVVHGV